MGFEQLKEVYYTSEFVQKNVLPRNVFWHHNSVEQGTTRSKDKYKVLINRITELGVYIFCTTTSTKDACPARARIAIEETDYEVKKGKHPIGTSYVNVEKTIHEHSDVLCGYYKQSAFEYLGKINQLKLSEIKNTCLSVKAIPHVSADVKDIVSAAAGDITNFVKRFSI